ncbi:Ankyrin repeat and SAM domain-containing protein 3 [Chionoecetes opilio]|uniref:Ankyrin repeat and SAM domain-containing protein 3 n=1 Tax=Chionoecetes opilio TaxID=41210 RepID=A0A8J4Y072_CHIOP|nr:Ankyrin repeat and SAM domain-containing protein 3 [Chionoecetes opilio]
MVEVLLGAGAQRPPPNTRPHRMPRWLRMLASRPLRAPSPAALYKGFAQEAVFGGGIPQPTATNVGGGITAASRSVLRNDNASLFTASVQPTDLGHSDGSNRVKFLHAMFREQDVDLQVFLTLTDPGPTRSVGSRYYKALYCGQSLREHHHADSNVNRFHDKPQDSRKLGPRRKMTSADARWHANAPLRALWSGAYPTSWKLEMQELGVKLTHDCKALEQQSMVSQESDLRSVTEEWVVEARGRLHQCYQHACLLTKQVSAVRHCLSYLSAQVGLIPPSLGQPSVISTALDL